MRIISKTKLRAYWESLDGRGTQGALESWHAVVLKASWKDWSELKKTYGSADLVGDCIVFNICGNHHRLVTRIRFKSYKVFVLGLMSHKEYDKDKWKTECGCYTAPPPKKILKPEVPSVAKRPLRKR